MASVLTLISLIIVHETKDTDYNAASFEDELAEFESDELVGTGV